MATPQPLLSMRGVNKHFGATHVLADIDLDIAAGEVVVVIGPSGSGKSTLCRTVNGLESIGSGSITIDGVELPTGGKELERVRADVGMVFQSFNLFADLTVLENVTLGPTRVRGLAADEAEARAMGLLERVGVADQAGKMPEHLSGGQKQRVAIARALAMRPKLMLFDEPTSALDPESVGEVQRVLTDLAESGLTMLVVTHEMGFARRAADRVVFLADGRILEQASPGQFFTAPTTARARDFLSDLHH